MRFQDLRVLWRHPYTGGLYGIPYEMRPGQSPTDIWRAPARREIAWSPKLGAHERHVNEVIPDTWVLLDERDPDVRAWLKGFEAVDPGITPNQPYEWSKLLRRCARSSCMFILLEGRYGTHRDTGDRYCLRCTRQINEACGEPVVAWTTT